jgi:hypothetical protein
MSVHNRRNLHLKARPDERPDLKISTAIRDQVDQTDQTRKLDLACPQIGGRLVPDVYYQAWNETCV